MADSGAGPEKHPTPCLAAERIPEGRRHRPRDDTRGRIMDFETIASLRRYLSIKHSLPGRLRIKFSEKLLWDQDALALARSPLDVPKAVTDTRLNIFSRTLLIEYDHSLVSPDLLEELITCEDDTQAAAIVEQLHVALYP
jgi:hypothetical protein